jgi:hypothetical protein
VYANLKSKEKKQSGHYLPLWGLLTVLIIPVTSGFQDLHALLRPMK